MIYYVSRYSFIFYSVLAAGMVRRLHADRREQLQFASRAKIAEVATSSSYQKERQDSRQDSDG